MILDITELLPNLRAVFRFWSRF